MRPFREVLARLQAFRSKFEGLLASARKRAARARVAPAGRPTRLRELTGFGANPGNLRMFAYASEQLPPNAPLVIALHGCTQTADEYDHGTGWSSLADSLGFTVVYPQQQPANNPKNCFSWFLPGDIVRGHGEALSIREMVEHAIATFAADRRKVFVTGLSAGGAMGAPATFNKHSRPCPRSRDMPLRRLAIACGQHPDIAGHGRKSQYGMAPAIRS
jgi:poly(3-hydroxybutyrate) depolymerase